MSQNKAQIIYIYIYIKEEYVIKSQTPLQY